MVSKLVIPRTWLANPWYYTPQTPPQVTHPPPPPYQSHPTAHPPYTPSFDETQPLPTTPPPLFHYVQPPSYPFLNPYFYNPPPEYTLQPPPRLYTPPFTLTCHTILSTGQPFYAIETITSMTSTAALADSQPMVAHQVFDVSLETLTSISDVAGDTSHQIKDENPEIIKKMGDGFADASRLVTEMSSNKVNQSSNMSTPVLIIDNLDDLCKIEKTNDAKIEDLKQLQLLTPGTDSITFAIESSEKVMKRDFVYHFIGYEMTQNFKFHENEYGKISSKFYDNFKKMINATQVFDFSSETKCVKALNYKLHRNSLGWEGEGETMCSKLHEDTYGTVEALAKSISEFSSKSLEGGIVNSAMAVLEDVSVKRWMNLRLLHGIVYERAWFGSWGYDMLKLWRSAKIPFDAFAYLLVIHRFVSEKKLIEDENVLVDMKELRIVLDVDCYKAFIQGYSKAGNSIKSLAFHFKMCKKSIKTNYFIASSIMQCLCRLGLNSEVVKKLGICLDGVVYNIAIDALNKLRKLQEDERDTKEQRATLSTAHSSPIYVATINYGGVFQNESTINSLEEMLQNNLNATIVPIFYSNSNFNLNELLQDKIRMRYVMGIHMLIQLQCSALGEEFHMLTLDTKYGDLLHTFAQREECIALCDALASRLVEAGKTLEATPCYICAGNIEKLVEGWSKSVTTKQNGNSYVGLLQGIREHTMILAEVVNAPIEKMSANGGYNCGMNMQEVWNATQMQIGATGLLDYMLKSSDNIIVGSYIVCQVMNPQTRESERNTEHVGENGAAVQVDPDSDLVELSQEFKHVTFFVGVFQASPGILKLGFIMGYETMQIFSFMVKERVEPNSVIFLVLLSACSYFGLLRDGCKVFYSMNSKFGTEPQASHYTCIVDLLDRFKMFKEPLTIMLKLVTLVYSGTRGAPLSVSQVHENQSIAEITVEMLYELVFVNAAKGDTHLVFSVRDGSGTTHLNLVGFSFLKAAMIIMQGRQVKYFEQPQVIFGSCRRLKSLVVFTKFMINIHNAIGVIIAIATVILMYEWCWCNGSMRHLKKAHGKEVRDLLQNFQIFILEDKDVLKKGQLSQIGLENKIGPRNITGPEDTIGLGIIIIEK